MHRKSNSTSRLAALILAVATIATAGCLSLTRPGSNGLSIVAQPDTTPIVIAPLSITMVGGPSASPQGLAYAITVRNTADTVAGFSGSTCGGITLRAGADTTGATVSITFPPCPPVVDRTMLQPGESTTLTRLLANSYIAGGTASGDYYVWLQLPIPVGGTPRFAAAGRVHWAG